MSTERELNLDPRIQGAVDDLRHRIQEHYPTATFEVSRAPEEPENIHLTTTLDLDDTEEVLDLLQDRLLELQIDERIPVYVIPVRTPERVLASMQAQAQRRRHHLSTIFCDADRPHVVNG